MTHTPNWTETDTERPPADGAARCKHCERWTDRYSDECQRCGEIWHEDP